MRFVKQQLFKKIDKKGQELIEKVHITIFGCGALGSVAAELLARAGIGRLTLIDRDFIELSNLQRQSLYTEKDVNSLKALVLAARLKEINSQLKVKAFPVDLDTDNLNLLDSDLILDCTDNFYTRFVLNDYAKKEKIPWVYASALGASGFVYPILPKKPCFSCIFPEPSAPLGSCDTEGVLNTTVHAISSLQVTEALKIVTKQKPSPNLISLNIWNTTLEKIKVKKKKSCPACQGKYEYLSGMKSPGVVKMCGTNLYQIKGKPLDIEALASRLSRLERVRKGKHCLFFREMVIFKDGRALIRTDDEKRARSLYDRYLG